MLRLCVMRRISHIMHHSAARLAMFCIAVLAGALFKIIASATFLIGYDDYRIVPDRAFEASVISQ